VTHPELVVVRRPVGRCFFSARGTVEQQLLPSNKGWGSGRACGEAVGHGLVDMKCWTVKPCCVPGSDGVDGDACSSRDKAVGTDEGMVK